MMCRKIHLGRAKNNPGPTHAQFHARRSCCVAKWWLRCQILARLDWESVKAGPGEVNFSADMQSSRLVHRPKSLGKPWRIFSRLLETCQCQCIWIQTRSANHQWISNSSLVSPSSHRIERMFGIILVYRHWFWARVVASFSGATGHCMQMNRNLVWVTTHWATQAVCIATDMSRYSDPYLSCGQDKMKSVSDMSHWWHGWRKRNVGRKSFRRQERKS
jgi:hypothetical protein